MSRPLPDRVLALGLGLSLIEEGAELVGWIWIASTLTAMACRTLSGEEDPAR